MIEFFGWFFLACAALSVVNAYRHASRNLSPSYWGGASAEGQACLAGASIAMAAVAEFAPAQGTPVRWGVMVLGVAIFWLGLHLEKRALREASQHAHSADAAPRRR